MCGIAGIVGPGGHESADILPLVDAQAHRGPDASGLWSDDLCVLGHRRLSVIDLSDAARQPLSNPDGSIQVTFNGEIYNYQALRDELRQSGACFRTNSDTEVVVHAYERWGTGCVTRFQGMFAFGLWDQRQRRLMLARDRVGKKPLVYAMLGNRFLFASELQALLADRRVPRAANVAAIDAYLSWGYIPAPATAFDGIYKLPPAHWMTVDVTAEGFRTRLESYWSLEYLPKGPSSEYEAAATLRQKLDAAVRLRLTSDVPLGAFLSGGIDSSVVVGLMATASRRPVQTFSIGFDEAPFDELSHARRVAARWRTDHHELVVRPDALAILPKLVRHYGEPHADSSVIPTFYLSAMTRAHVTVALSGDGGDESFAGYERYRALRLAERLRAVPGGEVSARVLARSLPDSIDPRNRIRRAKRFAAGVALPLAERYGRWVQYFREEDKQGLWSPAMRNVLDHGAQQQWRDALFGDAPPLDPIDAAMSADVRSYLPYDLLVKTDVASMANSLEVRSPFLDPDVMEFAARLPAAWKLRGGRSKHILKQACADLLDRETLTRPKMGFGVPIGRWLRGPLRDLLCDTLLAPASMARGYFDSDVVGRLVQGHLAGHRDHGHHLWSLLMLELWQREFIDRAGTTCPN